MSTAVKKKKKKLKPIHQVGKTLKGLSRILTLIVL